MISRKRWMATWGRVERTDPDGYRLACQWGAHFAAEVVVQVPVGATFTVESIGREADVPPLAALRGIRKAEVVVVNRGMGLYERVA